jgi:hypothetical protein
MRRIVIAIVSAALMLSACGNAADNLTEQIVESESGGDMEISDDSIVFQSDDGDATMTVTGDDEGVSISGTDESGEDINIQMGGTEVPDDFPMPIFDPSDVTLVSSFEMATGSSYSVTLKIDPGDAADAIAFYKDWIEGESMSMTSSNEMVIGEGDEATAIVQVAEYGDYSEVVMTWTPNS